MDNFKRFRMALAAAPLPWRPHPTEAGCVIDAEEDPVVQVDVDRRLIDQDAVYIAQAIASAMNAAGGVPDPVPEAGS